MARQSSVGVGCEDRRGHSGSWWCDVTRVPMCVFAWVPRRERDIEEHARSACRNGPRGLQEYVTARPLERCVGCAQRAANCVAHEPSPRTGGNARTATLAPLPGRISLNVSAWAAGKVKLHSSSATARGSVAQGFPSAAEAGVEGRVFYNWQPLCPPVTVVQQRQRAGALLLGGRYVYQKENPSHWGREVCKPLELPAPGVQASWSIATSTVAQACT